MGVMDAATTAVAQNNDNIVETHQVKADIMRGTFHCKCANELHLRNGIPFILINTATPLTHEMDALDRKTVH